MKKKHIILIHIVYWFYIVFQSYFLSVQAMGKYELSISDFTFGTLEAFIFFYCFYFMLPYLFKKKNKIISIGIGIFFILLFALCRESINVWAYNSGLLSKPKEIILEINIHSYLYQLRGTFVSSIYAILIFTLIEWLKSLKMQTEFMKQKHDSELALLRSQISPHFLFNTLNNIDSLITRDPEKASASMIKLSEIMRYMIYDTSGERVSLQKEIEYLESFIELQKLRIKDQDYISFTVHGDVSNKTIAPMLFIPFIENAFKHGSKNIKSPGVIISIEIKNDEIFFNSLNYYNYAPALTKDKTSGIGLSNVKRRLELIYKDNYNLKISNENGMFNVSLKIKNFS